MKKATLAVCGVAAGYILHPYIKKGLAWLKLKLVDLSKKLDEAVKDEVPAPEEEVQPEIPNE
jgi:hypothetical protein